MRFRYEFTDLSEGRTMGEEKREKPSSPLSLLFYSNVIFNLRRYTFHAVTSMR